MMNLQAVLLPLSAACVLGAVFYSEEITSERPEPGPIHISYWEKWTGNEMAAMKAVVDDFNHSQRRIHVDLLSISGVDQKTLMAVSADVPPDVAGLFGGNVAQYADDRAIEPLDGYCKEAGISAKDYLPSIFNMVHYDGHIWALPSTPAAIALHYNRDLLERAGYDRPPATIEAFDKLADKISVVKDGKVLVAGFVPSDPGWWNWAFPVYFGGSIVSADGKRITAESPETIASLEWVQSFTKKFGVEPFQAFKSGFGNFDSPQNPFMTGKVGLELQGVWMANIMHQNQADIHWGVAAFPHPAARPDLASTALVDTDIFTIPRGCKHPKEAFEFIKFVESQKEMEKLCSAQWKFSPLTKVSAEFWAHHKNPYIRFFYDLASSKNAFSVPKMGIWPELGAEFGTEFDSVGLVKKTPTAAMEDFASRMQPKLDEYERRHDERLRRGL